MCIIEPCNLNYTPISLGGGYTGEEKLHRGIGEINGSISLDISGLEAGRYWSLCTVTVPFEECNLGTVPGAR
jgi:hypothetical protein